MPRFQAKLGAAVIDKIVFGIETTVAQLRLLVVIRPVLRMPLVDQRDECGQEGRADVTGQCKVRVPVASVPVIIKNPPYPARTLAVRDEEIFVGPGLELRIELLPVRVAGALHLCVEMRGILIVFDAGVQIGTATEPPGVRGPEHARVHVNRWRMGVLHMGDQADTGGPEPWIVLHARYALAGRHRSLRAVSERAEDGRDVDADLLEHAAAAHDAHFAAPGVRPVFRRAAGFPDVECAGWGRGLVSFLQGVERRNDLVPQGSEPRGRLVLFVMKLVCHLTRPRNYLLFSYRPGGRG